MAESWQARIIRRDSSYSSYFSPIRPGLMRPAIRRILQRFESSVCRILESRFDMLSNQFVETGTFEPSESRDSHVANRGESQANRRRICRIDESKIRCGARCGLAGWQSTLLYYWAARATRTQTNYSYWPCYYNISQVVASACIVVAV